MILRNVAIRHGRRALATPLRKSSLRALSTETLVDQSSAIERAIINHEKETHSIEANINQLHVTKKLVPPTAHGDDPTVATNFRTFKHAQKRTRHLGSIIEEHYEPHKLVLNPPKPEDVTLELLMASQSHLGHATSLWNPANQRYIYGIRDGIHIISLETTAAHLRRAAKVVEGVAYHGGLILFVGTRKGQSSAVVRAAKLSKGCHLFERWIPGSITNGNQILRKCDIRAVNEHDEVLEGFNEKIDAANSLKPDLVVVLNTIDNYLLLHECGLNNIPTIGVVDTDTDPTWVTYPIPANDDSLRCMQLVAGVLGRAGEEGQRKRLKAAKSGTVTWHTPPSLASTYESDEARQQASQTSTSRVKRSVETAQKEAMIQKRDDQIRSDFADLENQL